jgi:hypothetical protein
MGQGFEVPGSSRWYRPDWAPSTRKELGFFELGNKSQELAARHSY